MDPHPKRLDPQAAPQPRWGFDPQHRLQWADEGLGRTAYAYDPAGRLVAAVAPDGQVQTWTYNPAGRLARHDSGRGRGQRFEYDAAGRLTASHYRPVPGAGHGADFSIRYRYDEDGRLAEAALPGCLTRYTYLDGQPWPVRLEQTTHCPTLGSGGSKTNSRREASFRYTSRGQLAAVQLEGFAPWLCYRYDDQGRLMAVGYDGAPDLVRLEYAAGDPPGDPPGGPGAQPAEQVRLQYANGATGRLQLDRLARVQAVQVISPEGEALLDLKYRSGEVSGLPSEQLSTGGLAAVKAVNAQRYEYDAQGRLAAYGPLGGERTRYRYDAAGNRLETRLPGGRTIRYSYDRQGRLSSAGAARYAYDRTGNLAVRRTAGHLRQFYYDPAGRMVRAAHQGRLISSNTYDHAGRRVCKALPGGFVHFLRDPWGNLLAEYDSDGEIRLYLGPAGRPLVCLVVREGVAQPLYLHADHLGSVRMITGPTGEVLARCDFDPFGNLPAVHPATEPVFASAGGPLPDSLRIFAGHPFDCSLGWYEAGVRWYDPQVGRFTGPDPYTFSADDPRLLWLPTSPGEHQALQSWLRQPGLRNRYTYALNNPLTYVDPDGRSAGLYALYIFLGIFWALPYTLFGFLIFEVLLNWVTFAFLWDLKDHGYSGEASPRLGAWAWWVKGGLSGKLFQGGATFGNFVVFNTDIFNSLDDTVRTFGIPSHHGELVELTCDTSKFLTFREGVVEHELRHTNQYGWWGPFWMPILLIGLFLVYNLLLTLVSVTTKAEAHVKWGEILDTFFGSVGQGILTGVGLLLSPGIYGWSVITQGYTGSFFELNAAKHSGQATAGQKVLIVPNKDSVAKGGEVILSVITDPSNTTSLALTLKENKSGAAGGPTQDTTCVLTNLQVYRYIAGPNAGKDVLEATDGSDTETVEIEVK